MRLWILVCFSLTCAGQEAILWRNPGRIERIDFSKPAGGVRLPAAPFRFVSEETGGTSPKILVRDRAGVVWRVKGGVEARPEAFVTRLAHALGYFAEPTAFVPQGRIEGVSKLKRASDFIRKDGSFAYAAFERRDPSLKYVSDLAWGWDDNPFVERPEMQGLKILVMLVSGWDNKDSGNKILGSNTGVLVRRRNGVDQHLYFVTDWGRTMGKWGRCFLINNEWDCKGFLKQNDNLVKKVENQEVQFGFAGRNSREFKENIRVEDVRWLMQYLGRVTDRQVNAGLLASGATKEEAACFTRAIRERIEVLRGVAKQKGQEGRAMRQSPRPYVAANK